MASSVLANYIIIKVGSYSCPCAQYGDIYVGWIGFRVALIPKLYTKSSRVVRLNLRQIYLPRINVGSVE
jgi:hypothetical protein